MRKTVSVMALAVFALMMLSGCASQAPESVVASAPGFFSGIWHGMILSFSLIGSLFDNSISIYSVPNNGGWYNFGFVIGAGGFPAVTVRIFK